MRKIIEIMVTEPPNGAYMEPYKIIQPFRRKMGPLAKTSVTQAVQQFLSLIEDLKKKA